jgi:hypothetical protein
MRIDWVAFSEVAERERQTQVRRQMIGSDRQGGARIGRRLAQETSIRPAWHLINPGNQRGLRRKGIAVGGAETARQLGRFQHHAVVVQGLRFAEVLAARCRFGADEERERQQDLPSASARGSSKGHSQSPAYVMQGSVDQLSRKALVTDSTKGRIR